MGSEELYLPEDVKRYNIQPACVNLGRTGMEIFLESE